MAFNWLFGKPSEDFPGYTRVRSLVFDHDGLRDLLAECRRIEPGLTLVKQGANPMMGDPNAIVLPEDLERLSDWEISRLFIARDAASTMFVDLRTGQEPTVNFLNNAPGQRQVIAFMLATGKPRIRWTSHHLKPLSIPCLLVATWVWFVVAVDPPLSLAALTAILGGMAVYVYVKVPAKPLAMGEHRPLWPGHRIRRMSREQVWAQRANTYANLKVALITLPVGAILGVLGTLITK